MKNGTLAPLLLRKEMRNDQFRDSSFEAIPSGCNPMAMGAQTDHSRDCNEDRRSESEVVVN
jgi:hypothetical protein